MKRIEGKLVQLIIPADQMEGIVKIQERHGITQSEAIRNLLGLSIDIYGDFEKIGLVKFIEVVDRTKALLNDNCFKPRLF